MLRSEQLIDFTLHFLERTSWQKLFRLVAWYQRSLKKPKYRISVLTSSELASAKLCLCWIVQDCLREPVQQRL